MPQSQLRYEIWHVPTELGASWMFKEGKKKIATCRDINEVIGFAVDIWDDNNAHDKSEFYNIVVIDNVTGEKIYES